MIEELSRSARERIYKVELVNVYSDSLISKLVIKLNIGNIIR